MQQTVKNITKFILLMLIFVSSLIICCLSIISFFVDDFYNSSIYHHNLLGIMLFLLSFYSAYKSIKSLNKNLADN
jgi:hypothetical protein